MLTCPWKTAQDIQRYMCGCILRYDGVPYGTTYVSATKIALYKLDQFNKPMAVKVHEVSPYDEKLDIESPPLGYFNYEDQAQYVERQPYKQFSQGLTDRNTCIYNINGNRIMEASIYCQGVEDMILGKYPTLEECWEKLNSQASIAISRDVALSREKKGFPTIVHYKDEVVGFISPGTMKVVVPTSDRGWIISKYLAPFSWEVE